MWFTSDAMKQKEFYTLMYKAFTPYYQIISWIFIICGILSIIASFAWMITYIIPGIASLFFGIILALFIKKIKKEATNK